MSLDLRVKRPPVPVDLSRESLERISTLGHAFQRCAEACGSQDKSVVADVNLDKFDAPVWSRVKAGQAVPSWDVQDRLHDACGNDLPLMWMLHKRGYDPRSLRRYETDIERENRELRERLRQVENERAVIVEFVKQARAA